jgi:uncharacterized protein (TIGR00255 family)
MIQSMTGFATTTLALSVGEQQVHLTISIKSLNSRFFEASCRLPHALTNLETDMTKILKEMLLRGHVYCTIHLDNPNAFAGGVSPAFTIIASYVEAINAIKKRFDIEQPLHIDHLIRLPNIFSVAEEGIDKSAAERILTTVRALVEQVITERIREGMSLLKDLEKRLAAMTSNIHTIEEESKRTLEEHKQKVHKALEEVGGDESQLADARRNALYTTLDKIDIHEEIVRFKSHLANLSSLLHAPDIEKGKRIDFTLQELAREINTITAKCSDSAISTRAIDVKVEIEKAREQAQNIV